MATTIQVTCPECDKQIKAAEELQGKKIRCKGCGHVFVVKAPGGKKAAPKAKAPAAKGKGNSADAAKKPADASPSPAAKGEDGEDDRPYTLTEEKASLPRCPHCTQEMESEEAFVCLNCGYNTRTRNRSEIKLTIEATPGEKFMWLLPAFLCIGFVLFLIIENFVFIFILSPWYKDMAGQEDSFVYGILGWGGTRLWKFVISALIAFACLRFACKRLIYHPVPPEKVKA